MAGRHHELAIYRECRRNHALAAGGHTVDGCREYAPPAEGNDTVPEQALLCQACGCHRSFHRRELVAVRANGQIVPPPPPPAQLDPLPIGTTVPFMMVQRTPVNLLNANRHLQRLQQHPLPHPPIVLAAPAVLPPPPNQEERERELADREENEGEIEYESQSPPSRAPPPPPPMQNNHKNPRRENDP